MLNVFPRFRELHPRLLFLPVVGPKSSLTGKVADVPSSVTLRLRREPLPFSSDGMPMPRTVFRLPEAVGKLDPFCPAESKPCEDLDGFIDVDVLAFVDTDEEDVRRKNGSPELPDDLRLLAGRWGCASLASA